MEDHEYKVPSEKEETLLQNSEGAGASLTDNTLVVDMDNDDIATNWQTELVPLRYICQQKQSWTFVPG